MINLKIIDDCQYNNYINEKTINEIIGPYVNNIVIKDAVKPFIIPIFMPLLRFRTSVWENNITKFLQQNKEETDLPYCKIVFFDIHEAHLDYINVVDRIATTIDKKVYFFSNNKLLDDTQHVKHVYCDTFLNYIKPQEDILDYNNIEKRYINLTRVASDHRIMLVDRLINEKLFYSGYNTWSNAHNNWEINKSKFPNNKIDTVVFNKLDVEDLDNTNPNNFSPIEFCKKSFTMIVTETKVDNTIFQTTEKTYRPIALGMPFIILGNPGTLYNLRQRGFLTFDKFFNEKYDLDLPIEQRIEYIIKTIKKYSSMPIDILKHVRKEMEEICKHNLELYKNLQYNYVKENLKLVSKGML